MCAMALSPAITVGCLALQGRARTRVAPPSVNPGSEISSRAVMRSVGARCMANERLDASIGRLTATTEHFRSLRPGARWSMNGPGGAKMSCSVADQMSW